ncbi:MAG: PQQ-binding-like beta-propeller repeat protein [Chitinivibrionales bacterium]|nr:PQQ-binding-like beta-propeller repeat protein [Chitinivibrionales bacterium]MBD3357045.1 PQQ-binding-like beta-propeller repeat protein [Chitinivibrionales bacterium]
MDCKGVRRRLELFVLDELSDIERRACAKHIERCAQCRDSQRALRAIVASITQSTKPRETSEKLRRSLQQCVEHDAEPVRGLYRFGVFRYNGLRRAAAVMLFLAGASFLTVLVSRHGGFGSERESSVREQIAFHEIWRHEGVQVPQASLAGTPATHEGKAFVLDDDDHVVALELSRGRRIWVSSEAAAGYLAADEKHVYAVQVSVGRQCALVAFDAGTGKITWRYRFSGDAPGGRLYAPVCAGSNLCWLAGSEVLFVNVEDGTANWRSGTIGHGPLSQPAVYGDHVYVASSTAIHCFGTTDGALEWQSDYRRPMSDRYRPLLAVSDGRVFAAHRAVDGTGVLMSFVADRGTHEWTDKDYGTYQLAAENGRVYARGHDIRAIDATSGKLLWVRGSVGCSPLTIAGNRLFYTDAAREEAVVVVDTRTGELEARCPLPKSCTGFHLAGNVGLVGSNDGVLRAMRPRFDVGRRIHFEREHFVNTPLHIKGRMPAMRDRLLTTCLITCRQGAS